MFTPLHSCVKVHAGEVLYCLCVHEHGVKIADLCGIPAECLSLMKDTLTFTICRANGARELASDCVLALGEEVEPWDMFKNTLRQPDTDKSTITRIQIDTSDPFVTIIETSAII